MEVSIKTFLQSFALMFLLTPVSALEFDQQELIILKGNDPQLAADEGYLYFPFQSNTELKYILLDHVDSGKSIKFKNISSGENHALLKLKAGKYYWKRIRKELGNYVYQVRYKKDDHQFEVKPGKVNYVGNWMFNMQFRNNGMFNIDLTSTNKFSYEWLNYQTHYSQFINQLPLEYVGSVKDMYPTKIQSLLSMNHQVNKQSINLHGLPKNNPLLNFYDTSDGVAQQSAEFPELTSYVKNNDRKAGDMSPSGEYIILHSRIAGEYVIELLHTQSFVSYVLFKKKLHENTSIRNLNWIDHDSFLYDLDFGNMSSTHVIHLNFDETGKLTGANQLEFPIEGVVVDTLDHEPNTLLFANFTQQESVRNDGRGLYRVDTTNSDTLKKSFWKTMKHTRQFDRVVQWMTDVKGTVRSAIEVEYDKKEELIIYHHWFLDQSTDKDEWVKIKSYDSDQEVPSPVLLSEDEQFFYTITNQFGEMKSIHKYSTKDYSYLGLFYEDKNHDIRGVKVDPSTKKVIAYSYIDNGDLKLNYFNDKDDRIKFLKEKNPGISLFVRQHNKETGNMLVFGYTSYSKGTWYLYNEHSKVISKLIDVNETYENLPKGDTHVINIIAEDGVPIEGYLVTPSAQTTSRFPLVVMPHGGPIGVRDYADNDELQHFYASHGLATLKINYRGSSGFGKTFESLGNGQWGKKIEADIHQMVQHVIKAYPLNGDKICAMGGSYGGYSALMLTALYPDTYDCAISFAGVVDLPLMFTGISASAVDEYHEVMKKIVGDPHADHQQMMEKSPFFLAEKLNKPIKLFHGQLDDTVSLEQSIRMVQALHLLNKEVDLTIFEDEAHSSKYVNTDVYYFAESLKFIQDKLGIQSTAKPYVAETTTDGETQETESPVLDYIGGGP